MANYSTSGVKNSKSIRKFLELSGKNRNLNILNVHLVKIQATDIEKELIKNYFNLIVNTNYFSYSSYLYLVKLRSYKKIAEGLNRGSDSYLGNITSRECKDLFEILTDDPYDLVFNKSSNRETTTDYIEGINEIVKDLLKTTNKRENNEYKSGKYNIDIGKDSKYIPNKIKNEYDNDKMLTYVKKMRVLSKDYVKFMLSAMDTDYINHIYYVLDTADVDLSNDEKELKDIIRRVWMLNEN